MYRDKCTEDVGKLCKSFDINKLKHWYLYDVYEMYIIIMKCYWHKIMRIFETIVNRSFTNYPYTLLVFTLCFLVFGKEPVYQMFFPKEDT